MGLPSRSESDYGPRGRRADSRRPSERDPIFQMSCRQKRSCGFARSFFLPPRSQRRDNLSPAATLILLCILSEGNNFGRRRTYSRQTDDVTILQRALVSL